MRLKVALVAIERPDGLLVERLLDAGLRVLALHPNQVAATRARFRVSGEKSDRFDAFVLCELARTDHHRFRVLEAAVMSSPFPAAVRPSGSTGVSSRPVRMPCPRATARRFTTQEAIPSLWWICSVCTPALASVRSIASAWAKAVVGLGLQPLDQDPDATRCQP